jgi:hypothetical protein
MAADIEEAALGDGRLVDGGDGEPHFGKRGTADESRDNRDVSNARMMARHDILPDVLMRALSRLALQQRGAAHISLSIRGQRASPCVAHITAMVLAFTESG